MEEVGGLVICGGQLLEALRAVGGRARLEPDGVALAAAAVASVAVTFGTALGTVVATGRGDGGKGQGSGHHQAREEQAVGERRALLYR